MNKSDIHNIYFLHGDDPAGLKERVDQICASLGEPGMADLNLTMLDGKYCDDKDIRASALAIPFLADHRVIVLENPLVKITSESQRKKFSALLDEIPLTSWLVLIIPDQKGWRKDSKGQWVDYWKTLTPSHFLMKWASQHPEKVQLEGFALPQQRDMPEWIIKETHKQGGEISPQAASALAELTGSETQIARLEIEKLLMYVNLARIVQQDDVHLVSISQNQGDVFKLIDAIVNNENSRALYLLNELLETDEPISIFSLLVSQFRKMVVVKDAYQRKKKPDEIVSETGLSKYVIDKTLSQCRRFSLDELKSAYLRLSELDFEMKNGITPADLAIEYFMLELKPLKM